MILDFRLMLDSYFELIRETSITALPASGRLVSSMGWAGWNFRLVKLPKR